MFSGLDRVHAVELGGRRVGGELDALERRAEHVGDGASEKGLRATGRALEENVPVRESGDEQELDRAVRPMTTFETSNFARSRSPARSSYVSSLISATALSFRPARNPRNSNGARLRASPPQPKGLSAATLPTCSEIDIRGRPGLDVVGSPAELRAEVAGWPRKSTGTKASANKNELALAA